MIISVEIDNESRLYELEPPQLSEWINVYNRHPDLTVGEMGEFFTIKQTRAMAGIVSGFRSCTVQNMKHGYFYYRVILNRTKNIQNDDFTP